MSHDDVVRRNIAALGQDTALQARSIDWVRDSAAHGYSYNFSWMGRPVIQYPQDMVAMQEIIWSLQPDLVIETGIAHGGSLVYYAALLELNAACGGPQRCWASTSRSGPTTGPPSRRIRCFAAWR